MIGKLLYKYARKYVKLYEGFSYNFARNGEQLLLEKLALMDVNTVFDVGANVGEWTGMALDFFPKARIHSFELSEKTFKLLVKNVRQDRAVLNNVGLSDSVGVIKYRDYGEGSGVNTMVLGADFHGACELVDGMVTTGDVYCQQHGISFIDLLKIDVEGGESYVLQGFRKMLAEKRIKVVQFEYGYTNGDVHFLMKDFFGFFEDLGYKVGVLKPRGVVFSDFHYRLNDFESGPNFIAVLMEDADTKAKLAG
jgi:FkbM family methyltransferase